MVSHAHLSEAEALAALRLMDHVRLDKESLRQRFTGELLLLPHVDEGPSDASGRGESVSTKFLSAMYPELGSADVAHPGAEDRRSQRDRQGRV